jgi:plastocyanin
MVMRRLLALGAALLSLGTLLALAPSPGVARAATANVAVKDNFFDQANITVNVGDTVQWTWAGVSPHSVTADDGSFDSNPPPANFQTTGTFSQTFTTAGTFRYYCRVHGAPGGIGMSGIVTVQAAAPTATATTAAPTATSTPAPTSTSTAVPSVTAAATTTAEAATPAVIASTATPAAIAPAPTTPAGGASGGAALPSAGDGTTGGDGGLPVRWLIAFIAVGGALALGAAMRARRE